MKNIFKRISNVFKTIRHHRRQPLHLEFILSDYCNLNCKGCGHYSSLAEKEFVTLEQLERNASHLGRVAAGGINSVYLIGGETLLYPHLPEAMAILRRYFPNISVKLFTNGLMLPRMSDEFWESARQYDVEIAITRYPIAFDYDSAENLCRSKGVKHSVYGDRGKEGSFFRFALDPEKKQNGRISHFKCFNRGCLSVVGDRLYPCSMSACVEHLNKACGTDFRHLKGDWINVYDIRSVAEIKKLRDKPVPFCSYCKPNPQPTPYGPSRRSVSEWVDK